MENLHDPSFFLFFNQQYRWGKDYPFLECTSTLIGEPLTLATNCMVEFWSLVIAFNEMAGARAN